MNLFNNKMQKSKEKLSFNLADRMRPQTLDDIIGQEHLLGIGKPLRKMIESDAIPSIVLWGPPGCGKTTLAKIISNHTGMQFLSYSAVLSGINEIRKVIAGAEKLLKFNGTRSILFIDEIHRFNKAQQDAFLPFVEKGTIILIGATTENPSFEIISPLLSRMQIFVLNPLSAEHIKQILLRALKDDTNGLGKTKDFVDNDALALMTTASSGDARFALNILETCAKLADTKITADLVKSVLEENRVLYDKTGEQHYNLISALHKSIRDSDPDGALYWLARMLEAGEDRKFLARRLIRMAMEDIGLADPNALLLALAAKDAFDFIGYPEGDIALAEIAVYLAYAPKSNSVYKALGKALEDAKKYGSLPVPLHIRNAPTKLMKELGYGKNYKYAHDYQGAIVNQQHLPKEIKNHKYYYPSYAGFESKIKKRFEEMKNKKEQKENK